MSPTSTYLSNITERGGLSCNGCERFDMSTSRWKGCLPGCHNVEDTGNVMSIAEYSLLTFDKTPHIDIPGSSLEPLRLSLGSPLFPVGSPHSQRILRMRLRSLWGSTYADSNGCLQQFLTESHPRLSVVLSTAMFQAHFTRYYNHALSCTCKACSPKCITCTVTIIRYPRLLP